MRDLLRLLEFFLWVSSDVPRSRLKVVVVAIAGSLGGIASTAMMALITQTLTPRGTRLSALPWVLATLCLLLPGVRFLAQWLLVSLTQQSLLSLRLRLTRAILGAPLRHLEQLGPHRLVATLVNDINSIVDSIALVPTLLMQLALLVSCLTYLGWLSWQVLLEVSGFIVLGIVTYQLPVLRAFAHLRRAREHYDGLGAQIHALTQGTKELKMHRRRRSFLSEVEGSAGEYLRESRAGAVEGQPVQRIAPPRDLELPWVDLRSLPEPLREAESRRVTVVASQQPFDLSVGPNARLVTGIKGLELMSSGLFATAGEVRGALERLPLPAVDPVDLWDLGREEDWEVEIGWSDQGLERIDVCFCRPGVSVLRSGRSRRLRAQRGRRRYGATATTHRRCNCGSWLRCWRGSGPRCWEWRRWGPPTTSSTSAATPCSPPSSPRGFAWSFRWSCRCASSSSVRRSKRLSSQSRVGWAASR